MAEGCANCGNLEQALKTRDVIATAKGLTMARHSVSDGEAFALLAWLSQSRNVPVREISAEMVAEHNQWVSDTPGERP